MPIIPARLTSILEEANRIAPHRRGWDGHNSSDGTYVDKPGDHNIDSRGIVHAVDLGQSMPGTPYWENRFDHFDVWALCYQIAHDYIAASDAERRRRWRWLHPSNGQGYMVWFDGRVDIIFDPTDNLLIRQNGTAKTEHFQHAHFSIGHTVASENDTTPIFGSVPTPEADLPLNAADIEAIRQIVRQEMEDCIGGGSLSPPDAHATVVDVSSHYAKAVIAALKP